MELLRKLYVHNADAKDRYESLVSLGRKMNDEKEVSSGIKV